MLRTLVARACKLAAAQLFLVVMIYGQQPLTIDGIATYRERMALPPDAVFEATLEDVSLADAPSRVIGRVQLEKPGNPPFHFSISYDPAKIVANHTYSVRARITEGGRLLFTTDQQHQVLTQGHGSDVAMMMMRRVSGAAPSAGTAASAVPLREVYWKLVQLGDKPVAGIDQQNAASLIFHTDQNRVTGSGGCNRLTGSYTADAHSLRFGGIASTQMACLHGMETESAFFAALSKVRAWKIVEQQLELDDADGKALARFSAQEIK